MECVETATVKICTAWYKNGKYSQTDSKLTVTMSKNVVTHRWLTLCVQYFDDKICELFNKYWMWHILQMKCSSIGWWVIQCQWSWSSEYESSSATGHGPVSHLWPSVTPVPWVIYIHCNGWVINHMWTPGWQQQQQAP